ncbi:precorrin-6y C5,15-methyltransferase subunit CbiE [Planosporangium mesophilum]|uniref:Precorrin-6y C5,15-methyltransferase subunit CbiE n=1 Tax=Planosporangium mesophilum TaxID=689768 RepID=A0A8J3WYS7_9ACTN|nr:precorrin-6y C5,15-methyltransferase (decarboxylating) subunit CbiE [Planosporangium mesophilum]NJC86072.1 precorrin-6y C5,15-methyltransferase (decarboxylating) subunit CbiE [Planosporangium mesophilum]GII21502.1 precorrin-6y C5,15-methyltransferase subunit CbiE [Planosporangium mesophilum]
MITVIGCDGGPLPPAAQALLAGATLVVGAARHLDTVKTDAERIVLGNVADAVARLSTSDGRAVVLASGDPGFFGIVATLRRAGLDPEVVPAPSSVAHAFARLGLPWDDAVVVSAHGRDLRRAVNVCRAHRKVAVLTAPGAGPVELAEALNGTPRRIVVASRLGTPDERITDPDGDWADPNVVLVLGPAVEPSPRWVAGPQPGPTAWALPEAAFAHRDSMITKAEVRALVLARLGPRLGDLVWDVGAGSGSVAVECARLGAAVIAVEHDADACERVRRNAEAFTVDVGVVHGSAPAALAGLPEPDAVFVGGGGAAVLVACLERHPARVVAAYAALERVGPALSALTDAGYRADGTQLQANRFAPLPGGVHRLEATNPVYVVWGERP